MPGPGEPFGIVGCGVIGSGWAARILANRTPVIAYDPAEGAEARFRAAIGRAWPALQRLGARPDADMHRVRFASSIEEVAETAGFIQECVPENLALKQAVLAKIDAVAPPGVVIASSTSGLLPSNLQRPLRHPERLVVGHPFNPVYILPLVEIVGGADTSPEALEEAEAVYLGLDMKPLRVRTEIDGFLSDRLQEAMWREILHLVADGVATTGELDDAIIYGPGLRWAVMGTNLTFHLAGGAGGMRSMLEQFGPALEWPWTKLKAPPLTPTLIERMVEGTETQAGGQTVEELEAVRDEALIAIMEALESARVAAGEVLHRRRQRLAEERMAP